jgi:hypothetical protein
MKNQMEQRIVHSILTLLLAITACSCDWLERPEYSFPNTDQAIKSGLVEKGWIPKGLLPQSAKDIHINYDMDSNETWIAFHFDDSNAMANYNNSLNPAPMEITLPRANRSKSLSWWPSDLNNGVDFSTLHSKYLFYRLPIGHDGFIAIYIEQKQVYFWSHGS